MCVSYSGRCFTSQFLFGKSANRGECFHPCRRAYIVKEEQYGHELKLQNNLVMSAKDLCVLPFIDDLKKAGVKAFKIEGRNRDPLYVDTVTRVYREALDNKLSKERVVELMKELQAVYNKGFSSGFYLGRPTPIDFSEVENSSSDYYRSYLGKTVHIYPRVGVAVVRLSDSLKIGEKIALIDDGVGVLEIKVEYMEIENKEVGRAKKGQNVGIKFPSKVSKGAEVYKIKKRKC